MCIELPGQVVEVDDTGATVIRDGRLRRASTLFMPDVAPGDWVYLAAGTIVRRLDPEEAAAITATLRDAMSTSAPEAAPAAATGGSR